MERLLNSENIDVIYGDFIQLRTITPNTKQRILDEITLGYESINASTYIKIMYMFGIYFEESDNRNAARYCALRMMQVIEPKYRKKKSNYLIYDDISIDDDIEAFMYRYNEFLDEVNRKIKNRLTTLMLLVFALFFIILGVIFDMGFLFAILNSAMIALANYIYQKQRMPHVFLKKQLAAIEKYVDNELLEFDRYVRFM